MSKVIEFKKPEKPKECAHEFIKIHEDAIYCNECDVALNKMWLINNLKNVLFPDWDKILSVKKIKDAINEKNLIRDGKIFTSWIADLRLEADSLNRQIANQQQRLLELKSQQDLLKQPDFFKELGE